MTNPMKDSDEQKKHFEANLLDGDAVQPGQMLAATEVWEYLQEVVGERYDAATLTKILAGWPKKKYHKYEPRDWDNWRSGFNDGLDEAAAVVRKALGNSDA